MNLDAAISIAAGGIADINRALAVVSQNVANAGTPDYVREVSNQTNVTAGGIGMGVRAGPATRDVNPVLQQDVFLQDAAVSALQTRQAALQPLDSIHGTPGGGGDLASLLGALQDSFTALRASPHSQTQQSQVVASAQSLARQVNTLGAAYTKGRQDAQQTIVGAVGTLNASLATIGQLSSQIVQLKAVGQSTADLESQRDAAMHTVSQVLPTRFLEQPNGDMLALTSSGLDLPVHATGAPFVATNITLAPSAFYPGGGVPAITLNGVDVTRQLQGGELGSAVTLRDQTFPTYQGELDEFAYTLTTRFDSQGLTLFSDPAGAVPAATVSGTQASYVGYAGVMQVNPAVALSPSLVRDGTHAVAATGAGASAFTPNPAGGPAGFTGMITRVLSFTFGSESQSGTPQPAPLTSGLGPQGALSAPYAPPPDLAGLASALVGAQSEDSAQVTGQVATEQSVKTALQSKLSTVSSVSIDNEMSTMVQLQNAYGANAKIVSAVQAMWTQLLQMVP